MNKNIRSYKLNIKDKKDISTYKISFSDKGVSEISWDNNPSFSDLPELANQEGQIGKDVKSLIIACWKGDTDTYQKLQKEIPLDINIGTQFQKQVWQVINTIPLGKTLTYLQVAQQINNPKAVRAVGSACGKNPLPLIIPCHRITASNGLGGFGGGVERKIILLNFEGVKY